MRSLILLGFVAAVALADPFVRELHSLQAPSGGFHDIDSKDTDLASTSHALFLASLYGQSARINADDAATYVQGLATSNGAYGLATGAPVDLEATRHALASYLHLGVEIPEPAQVSQFIRSLANMETGLFESRKGDGGDVKPTALAIEALNILGDLPKSVQDLLSTTNEFLASKVSNADNTHKFVFDPNSPTPLSDDYYGIYLAKHAGFGLTRPERWAAYIKQMQNLDDTTPTYGGFFATEAKTEVTAEATAHAVMALALLGDDLGDEQAIVQFASSRKSSLRDTSFSHLALAHTSLFKGLIKTRAVYHTDGDYDVRDQVMEGLSLTPSVVISIFEGQMSHGGFSVSAQEKGGWSSDLIYSPETFYYLSGDEFDTSNKLGGLDFFFNLRTNVYPIGELEFSLTDRKSVGYNINIDDKVVFGGRRMEEGESVLPGTEFSFDVSFSTQSEADFYTGDFTLDFSVVDASNVVQYTSSVDGSTNTKPIALDYELTGNDFPAGDVTFLFEVKNEEGVHTTHRQVYAFEQQMVASAITFDGQAEAPKYKLGDSFVVSCEPASLKDLHTTSALSPEHASQRTFVMDLSSVQGTTYLTVPGVSSEGSSSYTFEATLPPSLDAIGVTVVSFRFVSASGPSVKLHPFDSDANEMYEDSSSTQFVVDANLQLSDVEQEPTEQNYSFGSVVPLKFKVQDSLSSQFLGASKHSALSVVLGSGDFESQRVTAEPTESTYEVSLEIDINTVGGSGAITIVATGADGESIDVHMSGSSDLVSYPVTIGGDIVPDYSIYSTKSSEIPRTAFVTTFTLSCDGQPLLGAKLQASVLVKNGSDYSVVANYGTQLSGLGVATATSGAYSLSVALDHDLVNSGEYLVRFVREVDLSRAQAGDGSFAAEPLFEVKVPHQKVETSGFWMQMELVTVIVLGALCFGVSSQAQLFDGKKHA